jgi:hypothetical protein
MATDIQALILGLFSSPEFEYRPSTGYQDMADLINPGDGGAEIRDLWGLVESARLFEDHQYGQWGLSLLSPSECRSKTASEVADRSADFAEADLVIGAFLGDSDLLIYSQLDDACRVRVATPLDERSDWYEVAPNLFGFLSQYVESGGEKYWE